MSALVLLHGFGSSFDHNWQQTGWVEILPDFGVTPPAIDLPGHGSSPPLTDPENYGDVDEEVRSALPTDRPIAGVGFSAGAELLLRLAVAESERFNRIVLLGLGDNVFESGDPAALVTALESSEEPEDVRARTFRRMARSAGNEPRALSAYLRRPRQVLTEEGLSRLDLPILVVLGDRDWVGPADRVRWCGSVVQNLWMAARDSAPRKGTESTTPARSPVKYNGLGGESNRRRSVLDLE